MTRLTIDVRHCDCAQCYNRVIHINKLYLHHFLMALTIVANYVCAQLISSYYGLPVDFVKYDNIIDLYGRTTFTGMHCLLLFYTNGYIGDGCRVSDVKENAMFLGVSLIANVAFSYISSLENLQGSLSADGKSGFGFTAITTIAYAGALVGSIILIGAGVYIDRPSLVDISLRSVVSAWFSLWAYALFNVFGNIHLHHTLITYVLCLWAFKKNRCHKLMFYISLGIFIQGAVSYGDTPLITAHNNTGAGCAGCAGEVVTETIIYKCEFDNYEDICDGCFL